MDSENSSEENARHACFLRLSFPKFFGDQALGVVEMPVAAVIPQVLCHLKRRSPETLGLQAG